MELNKIYHGDCLEVMKSMPENSIDTIITDPPYGIGFMGKEWDTFKPDFIDQSMIKDKRKHTQIASQRRSNTAGTYDQSLEGHRAFQKWTEQWAREALRVTKPGGTMLCFAGVRTQHRVASGIEDAGWILKDCILWLYGSGFPKATDISKQLDKGYERKVIGKFDVGYKDKERSTLQPKDGWNNNSMKGEFDITEPSTPEAKLWEGWKSHGLKPAYEPIIVAMKPNEGTYAANALKWGVSGLNIDGGRIGTKTRTNKRNESVSVNNPYTKGLHGVETEIKDYGRFPSNIILDKEATKFLPKDVARFFKVIN